MARFLILACLVGTAVLTGCGQREAGQPPAADSSKPDAAPPTQPTALVDVQATLHFGRWNLFAFEVQAPGDVQAVVDADATLDNGYDVYLIDPADAPKLGHEEVQGDPRWQGREVTTTYRQRNHLEPGEYGLVVHNSRDRRPLDVAVRIAWIPTD